MRQTLTPLTLLALAAASLPALAQYQCRLADGSLSYQQQACPSGAAQQKLELRDQRPGAPASAPDYAGQLRELEQRRLIREAISAGRPLVGMTRAELDAALGSPLRSSQGQIGADQTEQLSYQRPGRSLHVSLRNGLVVAFDDVDRGPRSNGQQLAKACASPREIRDIEIEINKLANRDNKPLQLELNKRLLDAKACR
ncbi:DUF4124 domain-containing protein [Pelomonas sp. SE-A7]|uniref:DUF4124 domain-containing protein n=1 Tax=Pelomonas sp. SE-A7 TaxID=3054953 RepID=UPI00259CE5F9|nr:DUF4124 domain-containing protein [Pelomonas sp. SE-A7]MDM4768057.1 DUF4124 domain-containing protein [Pelomonas sp. SE-A7]